MSCKYKTYSPLSCRAFTNITPAAVARKSSVASVMTQTTTSAPPLPSTILANVHSDARLDPLPIVLSLAALSSHACSSPVRSSSVSAIVMPSTTRSTKKPLQTSKSPLLQSKSKPPLPLSLPHCASLISPPRLLPSAPGALLTTRPMRYHSRWLLRRPRRCRCHQSSARLLRLRTAALSTTGPAPRAVLHALARSARLPRRSSMPRAATSALGALLERCLTSGFTSKLSTQHQYPSGTADGSDTTPVRLRRRSRIPQIFRKRTA